MKLLAEERQKKLAKRLVDRRRSMKAYRELFVDAWKDALLHVDAKSPQVSEPSRTEYVSTFIPETQAECQRALAALAEPFIVPRRRPWVEAVGRSEEDHQVAPGVEQLMQWDFEQMGVQRKIVSFFQQGIEMGSSSAQVTQDIHYVKRMRKVPWDKDGDGLNESLRRVVDEAEVRKPRFDVLDLFDFFVPPEATSPDVDEWADCAKDFDLEKASLKRHEAREDRPGGVYFNLGKIDWEGTGVRSDESAKEVRLDAQGMSDDDTAQEGRKTGLRGFEWWGMLPRHLVDPEAPESDDEEVPAVATLADVEGDAILIRAEQNPYWHQKKPFVFIVYEEVPFRPYGKGIPEILHPLQTLLNAMWNKLVFNLERITSALIAANPQIFYDQKQLEMPRGLVELKTNPMPGTFHQLQFAAAPAEAWNALSATVDTMQQRTSITRNVQGGQTQSSRTTATEFMGSVQQGLARLSFTFQHVASTGVARLAELTLAMDAQFMDAPQRIRILGARGYEWPQIAPEDIQGAYDFITIIDPNRADEATQRTALVNLMGVVKDPYFAEWGKPGGILQQAFELHGLERIPEMLRTEAEVQMERQQRMALQGAQGMPEPSGAPGAAGPPGIAPPGGGGPPPMPPGPQALPEDMQMEAHQSAEMAKPGPRPRGPNEAVMMAA